jgi:hypothetical protein
MDDQSILSDYLLDDDFCKQTDISPRTSHRYRNQPNGLPYMEWGGRIYIPIEPAREWFRARVKRPNQRRKAG